MAIAQTERRDLDSIILENGQSRRARRQGGSPAERTSGLLWGREANGEARARRSSFPAAASHWTETRRSG